jgi:hypothetical protein
MPCPFFEPRTIAATATFENGRLPLIDEYDGDCHLQGSHGAIDQSVRMLGCNHGNLGGVCCRLNAHFDVPQNHRAILRFHLQSRERDGVRVTVIEEDDFFPVRWSTIAFRLNAETFEPEIEDLCQRAQALAFCRSYLSRFPL